MEHKDKMIDQAEGVRVVGNEPVSCLLNQGVEKYDFQKS